MVDTFGPIVGESYGCGFLGVALLQSAQGNSPYAVVQRYTDHLLGDALEAIWCLDKAPAEERVEEEKMYLIQD